MATYLPMHSMQVLLNKVSPTVHLFVPKSSSDCQRDVGPPPLL